MSIGKKISKVQVSEEVDSAVSKLAKVAEAAKIDFFLIGATARDIIMQMHGIKPTRATRDVDFAIKVSSWSAFETIRSGLTAEGFNPGKIRHRLNYNSVYFDLVPFGGVEKPKGQVTWPEDNLVFSTMGFQDAFDHSHYILLPSGLSIRIANIAGLVVLKLMSWTDRKEERIHDATDIAHIIRNYVDAGNFDRLYDENDDLVEQEPFTFEEAGGRLLARDLKKMCSAEVLSKIIDILREETSEQSPNTLIGHMVGLDENWEHMLKIMRSFYYELLK